MSARYWRELVVDPIVGLFPGTRYRLVQAGYWVRPYDMLADRRRWRWHRPAPCGRQRWAALTAQQQADVVAWVRAATEGRRPE